jgi:hypothetical protein
MAEPRRYLGEQLTERLLARGERRIRVGVSSAFFARFGLANPWDFDPLDTGWGSFWFRFGRRRGVLGALWERFDSLGMDWMWPDRDLAAMARMPGSGLGRPRTPWGPFGRPRFSFLLPELEEIEAEEPATRRRFRRRPRRARRALAQPMPLVGAGVPLAEPLPAAAAAALPRGVEPTPVAAPAAARSIAASTAPVGVSSRPSPAAPPPIRALHPLARVLQRQQPTVGGPSLRRALAQDAPALTPFSTRVPVEPPALQGPMAWAETRLEQASSAPIGRPRPVTAPVDGAPPQAARRLLPVLFRSPSLAFLAPEPELEAEAGVEPPSRPARPAARRLPARRPPPVPGELTPPEAPTFVAADTVQAEAPRSAAAPSARAAQRLQQVQHAAPEQADRPYRSLRRASAPATQGAATPLLRAIERAPLSSATPRPVAAEPPVAPRSLDQLLTRAERSPGLPGRLLAPEAHPGDAPRAARAHRGARLLKGERAARPFLLRSPMLAFIDAVEREPGLEAEHVVQDAASARPRRARADRADAPVPRRARAATAALLRAEPPQASGRSVLSHPVGRPSVPAALSISDAAFPGRGRLARLRREATDSSAPWVASPRSMHVPWLPMDRLVQPVPDLPEAGPEAEAPPRARSVREAPSARPRRQAAAPAEPSVAAPPPTRVAPPAAPTPLRASARAAARYAEAWGTPVRPDVTLAAPVPPMPSSTPRPDSQASVSSPARRPVAAAVRAETPAPRRARVLPEAPLPVMAARPEAVAAPSASAPAPRVRPSTTQRALHRLDAGAQLIGPGATPAGQAVASPFGRQAWAFVRAPSTVWLQWRELDAGPTEPLPQQRWSALSMSPSAQARDARPSAPASPAAAPTPRRSWAPLSRSVSAPMRLAPAAAIAPATTPARLFGPVTPALVLPQPEPAERVEAPSAPGVRVRSRTAATSRALPSGRALRRLAAESRVQQRAVAVTGDEAPRVLPPRAPRAALVEPGVIERDQVAPSTIETSVQSGAPRRRARAIETERSIQIAAIDKLLGEGAGAQVLLPALARIKRPEDALRIVLERTLGGRGRSLPAPMRQLVEQVQAAADQPAERSGRRRPARRELRRESLRRQRPTSRRRAAAVPATQASATVHHVQANFRIVGLVKKLEELIHLVDVEHRLAAARSQVRMAEDAPGAQPSVSADDSSGAQAAQAGQDVDALVQNIVEFVSEEMALMSMRRPESPADRNPWF